MNPTELQQKFFSHLKGSLKANLSVADELADLLDISADSAYRRIRGEKPLSLQELKIICEKHRLSLDQILDLQNESVLFQAPGINQDVLPFNIYMRQTLQQLKYFNTFGRKHMMCLNKDMAFFHNYYYPEIAAFKSFFWAKTIFNDPEYSNQKFSLAAYPFRDYFETGQQMIREYNHIPSTELWNPESFNCTIIQIQFYKDAGLFGNPADMELVVKSFIKTIDHLELQLEKGVKFMPGDTDVSYKSSLTFYVNEVVLGNNTILLELDEQRLAYITYSVMQYIISHDQRFYRNVHSNFTTLLSRSTLISGAGERDRNRFFNAVREKANSLLR
ncbi:MAG: helix-turn-helix domain-containing protein [Chitinophagaceae bacterium]